MGLAETARFGLMVPLITNDFLKLVKEWNQRLMRLILVRHGHVEGISPPRFRGRADLPLTELGERQAQATAERLRAAYRPVALYTSPQRRAVFTARAIGAVFDLDPLELADFSDIDYGQWQGFSQEESAGPYLSEMRLWKRAPHLAIIADGEALADVAARVVRTIGVLVRRHRESDVVLVGHDSVNRITLLHALELPLSKYWAIGQAPCAINEIDFRSEPETDRPVVVNLVNDTWHLRDIHA